ncbi:hypothetical protein PPYR_14405 [Photinus pyralis]|uniref:UDP-glucuronosyltransferase n=2 Tax=Photinus pyralis TaxID=7054 RepID=A0A5N4A536_PHOPY|nr:UDP-glucuronosyltransferase 1-2-like [Photinus pyralis]KAB0792446.1 hypothetical protein PPYR_14405 [Photinus pyralis]
MGKMSLCVLTFSVVLHFACGAKILGIVPTPSYSHQVVFQPLWRELSLRGHQVTTLTTDPIKDPKLKNLTEFDLRFSYDAWNKDIMDSVFSHQENVLGFVLKILQQYFDVFEGQLRHPSYQSLINGNENFDLIIVEAVEPPMLALVEKYKCPLIGMLSLDAPSEIYQRLGNPTHPSLYPDMLSTSDMNLSLSQRIESFIGVCVFKLIGIYTRSVVNGMVQKYFGPNYSSVDDIMRNASMLFVNTDPIFHNVRPLVPGVIQIGGGSHLTTPRPLSADLQNLLDSATDGFIYFSLGTNVKSKDIPSDLRANILETFAELPYTVLWKFEAETLPNKPKNVHIAKWLPQQDVLGHRNIKLFITQGGLQSTDEAIYSGVPLLVIPFFGDQAHNSKKIVNKGMGLSIDYTKFEKAEFKETISELINNSKYRNRVKELANLALDQPMTGLERAVWWTEYVIRHKGARHLKSPLSDVPWHQYLLLDVIAVLLVSLVLILCAVYVIFRMLWRLLRKILPKGHQQHKKNE